MRTTAPAESLSDQVKRRSSSPRTRLTTPRDGRLLAVYTGDGPRCRVDLGVTG